MVDYVNMVMFLNCILPLQYQPHSSENACKVILMNYFTLAFSFFSNNSIRINFVSSSLTVQAMVDHANMVMFWTTNNYLFSDLKMCIGLTVLEFIVIFIFIQINLSS